jgi:hypothetical protein
MPMKQFIIRSVAAMLVVALFGAGCVSRQDRSHRNAGNVPVAEEEGIYAPVAASLRLEAGSAVTIVRDGASVSGSDEMDLYYGDQLTVDQGEATISYEHTGVSVLQEGTVVTIALPSGSASAPVSSDSLFVRLEVIAGGLWTRLERTLGKNETFQTGSNRVVATVRGTAFWFGYDGTNVDLKVAENEVELTDEDAPGKRLRIANREVFHAPLAVMKKNLSSPETAWRKAFVRAATKEEEGSRPFLRMRTQIKPELMRRIRRDAGRRRVRMTPEMIRALTPEQRAFIRERLQQQSSAAPGLAPEAAPTSSLAPTSAPAPAPSTAPSPTPAPEPSPSSVPASFDGIQLLDVRSGG